VSKSFLIIGDAESIKCGPARGYQRVVGDDVLTGDIFVQPVGEVDSRWELANDGVRANLFDAFCAIVNESELQSWCVEYGLPFNNHPQYIADLLASANSFRYLLALDAGIKAFNSNGKINDLRNVLLEKANTVSIVWEMLLIHIRSTPVSANQKWLDESAAFQKTLPEGSYLDHLPYLANLIEKDRSRIDGNSTSELTDGEKQLLSIIGRWRNSLRIRPVNVCSTNLSFARLGTPLRMQTRWVGGDANIFEPRERWSDEQLFEFGRARLVACMNVLLADMPATLELVNDDNQGIYAQRLGLSIKCAWHAMVIELLHRQAIKPLKTKRCLYCNADISHMAERADACRNKACRRGVTRLKKKVGA
jgi:hypothetical protein